MKTIKVAIVEDYMPFRDGLCQLVNSTEGFKCVGALADATDIVYQIQRIQPDVVLMDIDLPSKLNGIESTFEIKEILPEVSVIVLTVFEDKLKIFQALKAGASGYLLKNTPFEKLLESITEVVAGGAPMSPSVAHLLLEWFRKTPLSAPLDKSILSQLTKRQKEILNNIIKGKSYKQIATELFITVDTVKFHVKNIYETLHVASRHELVALVNR